MLKTLVLHPETFYALGSAGHLGRILICPNADLRQRSCNDRRSAVNLPAGKGYIFDKLTSA
jgi:hypothetical protein